MPEFFVYGNKETAYLKERDKKLGQVIDTLGFVQRPVQSDLFSALVNAIVGQQISTKAHATISRRMEVLGDLTPSVLLDAGLERLQSFGMTFRKAQYLLDLAERVEEGAFHLERIAQLPDGEAIQELCSLPGIGIWTAEMLLLHSLQRSDILSFGDLAILRGMRMVYRHREIDRQLFERLRKRYSPYGSIASIYLWKVSSGAIEGLTDPGARR